jgi:hypothetical protein
MRLPARKGLNTTPGLRFCLRINLRFYSVALALVSFLSTSIPASTLQSAEILTEETPPARGCATLLIPRLETERAAQRLSSPSGTGSAAAASVQATAISGRTYLTTHFAIHYTVAPNVHRARFTTADAGDVALKATVDSILDALPFTLTYKRDSTLHATLDTLGKSHPLYVLKAGEYFERAWFYYDSIGMDMPTYVSTTEVYDKTSQGRYVIDIADANIAGGFSGPYYGLAFPVNQGGHILFENDFLYAVTYNSGSDQITGTPVRAVLPGNVIYRDYSAADWEKGVQVTASHEFYHAVQYAYVPTLSTIHAWYELSATGMEERLAPAVNDYFQYLRFNIPKSHQTSLLTAQTVENYGNATFFLFMTHALGAAFDHPIWAALKLNNNVLPTALVTGVGSQARWDSLYAAYAGAMAISGTPGSALSPLAFSPDMPQWAKPRFDTLPLAGVSVTDLPPLTFRLFRPPISDTGIVTLLGLSEAHRIDSSVAGYQSIRLSQTSIPLTRTTGVTSRTLAVGNTSFAQTRSVALSKNLDGILATRNPATRSLTALFFLAPTTGEADSLKIVAESGRLVAKLPADTSQAYWNWNLKDTQNRTVPAGLYFFRPTGTAPGAVTKSLMILP